MVVILTEAQIGEIISYIQGSCHSLDEAIHAVMEEACEGLDEVENWRELCDTVDRQHFCCAQCGWWSEAGDYAEKQENPNGDICSDCEPEEDEDD